MTTAEIARVNGTCSRAIATIEEARESCRDWMIFRPTNKQVDRLYGRLSAAARDLAELLKEVGCEPEKR